MKGQAYFILGIVFIIVIAIFSVANMKPVDVDYFFGQGEIPLIYIILFSVLFGSLITILIGSVKFFKLKKENRALKENAKEKSTKPLKTTSTKKNKLQE